MQYAEPPGSWSARNAAVARADVQIDSSGTLSPERTSRADRSRGVKIELLVSTRKRRCFSTRRSRKSAAPGRAWPSCTSTPSMSVSQHWAWPRSLMGAVFRTAAASSAPVAGEGVQRVVGEPEDGPLVHGDGAGGLVEVDRRGVPVEHRPLEARVAALDADLGQGAQQLLAQAGAAVRGLHVEVLEVDAVRAAPGGVVEEPERGADDEA